MAVAPDIAPIWPALRQPLLDQYPADVAAVGQEDVNQRAPVGVVATGRPDAIAGGAKFLKPVTGS